MTKNSEKPNGNNNKKSWFAPDQFELVFWGRGGGPKQLSWFSPIVFLTGQTNLVVSRLSGDIVLPLCPKFMVTGGGGEDFPRQIFCSDFDADHFPMEILSRRGGGRQQPNFN